MNLIHLNFPGSSGTLINRQHIVGLRIEVHSRHNLLRFTLSLTNGAGHSSAFLPPAEFQATLRTLCNNLALTGYEPALEDALARAAASGIEEASRRLSMSVWAEPPHGEEEQR